MRRLLLVTGLGLVLHGLSGASPGLGHGTATELPPQAEAALSAALGRESDTYRAIASGQGFRVENPKHLLVAHFDRDGVQVRTGAAGWRLALRGWGHGDRLEPVLAALPEASANRVEYRRGPVSEWYLNGPLGLEQGFTLAHPPSPDASGPLTLALALSGDLTAALDPGGDGLTLRQSDGQAVLRYAGLVANDASGRELPAWLALRGDQLLVQVDDRGARYPVVVDPFIQVAKLTAADAGVGDGLGVSVAISGDTVVAGAVGDDIGLNDGQGSAYVFVKPPTGWADMTSVAKLTASDGGQSDELGISIAVSGDTVVVGAAGHPLFDLGQAYVFVKPAGGWASMTETAKLTASDGLAGDHFGISVGISGDTIVVGAIFDDAPFIEQGSAYVFEKPAGGWTSMTQTAKLTASDGLAIDRFGKSVGIDGDTIVVGANADDIGVNTNQGSVYVFLEPAGGWVNGNENAKLTASDGAANDLLGWSAAIDGDTVVVSAISSTYVFVQPAGGWSGNLTESAKLSVFFGKSVGVSGALIAVGSSLLQGTVHLFVEPDGGWAGTPPEIQALAATPESPAAPISVAVSGVTVVAGAPGDTVPIISQGSVYVFELSPELVFAGLDNDALGEATINTIAGEVVVSNIGASGTDGIALQLGEAEFGQLDLAELALEPDDSLVVSAIGSIGGVPDLPLGSITATGTASGNATVLFDLSGVSGQELQLTVYDGATPVLSGPGDSVEIAGAVGPCFMPVRPQGSGASATLELGQTHDVTIPGFGTVSGDRIVATVSSLDGTIDFVSELEVLGAVASGGGSFTVKAEALGMFGVPHTGVGEVLLDAAGGQLEVAVEDGAPLSGTAIDLAGGEKPGWQVELVPLALTGIDETMHFEATGTVEDEPVPFVSVDLFANGAGFDVYTDFPNLGVFEIEVTMFDGGTPAGTAVLPAGFLGILTGAPDLSLRLAAAGITNPCFIVGFDGQVTLALPDPELGATAGGLLSHAGGSTQSVAQRLHTSLTGDELHVHAVSPGAVSEFLGFSILAANTGPFTILGEGVLEEEPTPGERIAALIDAVSELPTTAFSNKNHKKTLLNKLAVVEANIASDTLCGLCAALDKLLHDILPKTDGESPPPDWVIDEEAQARLEEQIVALIQALEDEVAAAGGCAGC